MTIDLPLESERSVLLRVDVVLLAFQILQHALRLLENKSEFLINPKVDPSAEFSDSILKIDHYDLNILVAASDHH